MRPSAVIQGERVYLAATAVLLATSVIAWQPMEEAYGLVVTAGVTAFTVGAYLLLILLAARRGSRASLWLLILLTVFGVASVLYQIASGQIALGVLGVLNTVQVGLTVIGAVLLLRPAARAWFAQFHADWEEDA